MQENRFQEGYIEWRAKRISFLINKYGKEYFKGKTLLELGAGLAHVSKEFSEMGAIVTAAEGRETNVNAAKENFPDLEIILLDQDKEWDLNRKFDIIIHWGVLYHLYNWEQDIDCIAKHMHKNSFLCIESEVLNSSNTELELVVEESATDFWDTAINSKCKRISANRIEKKLNEYFSFERFDDKCLNTGCHLYDWEVPESIELEDTRLHFIIGLRRFWICTPKENENGN